MTDSGLGYVDEGVPKPQFEIGQIVRLARCRGLYELVDAAWDGEHWEWEYTARSLPVANLVEEREDGKRPSYTSLYEWYRGRGWPRPSLTETRMRFTHVPEDAISAWQAGTRDPLLAA